MNITKYKIYIFLVILIFFSLRKLTISYEASFHCNAINQKYVNWTLVVTIKYNNNNNNSIIKHCYIGHIVRHGQIKLVKTV